MKKILYFYIAVVFGLLLLSGCASTDSNNGKIVEKQKAIIIPPTPGITLKQNPIEAGEAMIVSVIKGFKTSNYPLYSRDFSEANKKFFTEESFKNSFDAVHSQLGKYQSRQLIGDWYKGGCYVVLWKMHFSNTEDDILAKMYLKKIDNRYQIIGFVLA